jgi:hypothetical protein
MIRALKVTMIVYGAIGILMGLMDITMHDLVAGMYGFGEVPGYVNWLGSVIGAGFITGGVWIIVAGRDPLRHINWVKFVIMGTLLALVVTIYAIIVGYVDFDQVGGKIIFDAIFAALFLAFYPWRAARISE